jgi:hypothetical protein
VKRNKPQGKMTLIFAGFFLCAIVLGIFMVQRYEGRDATITPTPVPQQTGPVTLTLFFGAPDGDGLVREGRNVDSCGTAAECITTIVQELASGPMGDLEQTLPVQTVVRSVQTERDLVTIDLEAGFAEGVPPGSSGEMAAVYSIVNSVIINFPAFRSVRLLLDGRPVETVRGHLDLRQPLAADFSLEKQPEQNNTKP